MSVVSDQDEIIKRLKERLEYLQDDVTTYEKRRNVVRSKAEFYLTMQRRLLATEDGPTAMQRFLTVMRLALPEDIRGFTTR